MYADLPRRGTGQDSTSYASQGECLSAESEAFCGVGLDSEANTVYDGRTSVE
jgi:hypothetical protein